MSKSSQTRREFLAKAAKAASTASAGLAAGALTGPGGCCTDAPAKRPVMEQPVIDIHVHTAAKTAPGCMISDAMRHKFTWLARLGLYKDVTVDKLDEDLDGTVANHLVNAVASATCVDKMVVLAHDGIYTGGALNIYRTQYRVTNRYVQRFARDHHGSGVLFGASINPTRRDAVDELKRCTGELPWLYAPGDEPPGPPPALLKWLPNAMEFDPSAGHETFLDALAERNIPLLCHAGKEQAVPTRKEWQKMGDPRLIRNALKRKVTVIVAHCAAATFLWDWSHHYVGELADMFAEAKDNGWDLYADVSALSMYGRSGVAIRDVLKRLAGPHGDRLVLGSDYPLLPRRAGCTDNPLDRNYHWLVDRGFPKSIGPLGAQILNPKALAWTPYT